MCVKLARGRVVLMMTTFPMEVVDGGWLINVSRFPAEFLPTMFPVMNEWREVRLA